MSQATDILDVIAARLWTLLEAQASITDAVFPGNRNKGDQVGWLRDAIAKAPADQRRLAIGFERGDSTLWTNRGGFANEATDFDVEDGVEFDVIRTQTVLIVYREPLPKSADPGSHAIQRSLEQTILLAGPTLGMSEIPGNGLGKLTWEERKTRTNEFPSPGRITTYRLPITTIQSGLALMAQTA